MWPNRWRMLISNGWKIICLIFFWLLIWFDLIFWSLNLSKYTFIILPVMIFQFWIFTAFFNIFFCCCSSYFCWIINNSILHLISFQSIFLIFYDVLLLTLLFIILLLLLLFLNNNVWTLFGFPKWSNNNNKT